MYYWDCLSNKYVYYIIYIKKKLNVIISRKSLFTSKTDVEFFELMMDHNFVVNIRFDETNVSC